MKENTTARNTTKEYVRKNINRLPFISLSEQEKIILEKLLNTQESTERITGISPLSITDLEDIVKIQTSTYKDNTDLTKELWKMTLIVYGASLLPTIHDYKNLSFIYRNKEKDLLGYLLAYMGNHPKFGDVIYMTDWNSLNKNNLVGGKLLYSFLKEYAIDNIQNGKNIPIYVNSRQGTSGTIVLNQLELLSKIVNRNLPEKFHIKFSIIHEQVREESGEYFIDMLIKPFRINE